MSKDEIRRRDTDNSPLKYRGEFEAVYSIISAHRERVVRVVNNESMAMVWEVNGYGPFFRAISGLNQLQN